MGSSSHRSQNKADGTDGGAKLYRDKSTSNGKGDRLCLIKSVMQVMYEPHKNDELRALLSSREPDGDKGRDMAVDDIKGDLENIGMRLTVVNDQYHSKKGGTFFNILKDTKEP